MAFLTILFALKLYFSMVSSSEAILDTECGLTGVTVALYLNLSYIHCVFYNAGHTEELR